MFGLLLRLRGRGKADCGEQCDACQHLAADGCHPTLLVLAFRPGEERCARPAPFTASLWREHIARIMVQSNETAEAAR
jgi:hypothetical protein